MKKLLVGILTATMLITSTAHAVTWNSTHGVITELTADHIAWINEHRADQDSGVLAGFLWVRHNDTITSIPLQEVRDAGSKEAAVQMIVEKIIEVEVIKEIEVIKETIIINNEEIDRLTGVIEGLQITISTLQGLNSDQAAAITALQDQLTVKVGELASMTAERDALLLNINGVGGLNETIRDLRLDVTAAEHARNLYQAAFNEVNASQSSLIRAMATAAGVTVDYVNGQIITNDPHGFLIAQHNFLNNNGPAQALVDAVIANNGFDLEQAKLDAHTAFTAGDSSTGDGYGAATGVDNVGATTTQGAVFTNTDLNWSQRLNIWHTTTIAAMLDAAVEKAYDKGYNDGYDAGYTDGYATGYADGVNAVN